MGTWGVNAFEDDSALGYYDEFCSSEQSMKELAEGIQIVLNQTYDMEVDGLLMEGFTEPTKALVYAEILATINGRPSDKLPDEEYHQEMELPRLDLEKLKPSLTAEMKNMAIDLINKVQSDDKIHLTVLWMESESLDEWKENLNDLKNRLSQ